jgi:hypothetical protein
VDVPTFDEPRVAFTVTGSPAITSNTLEVGSEYTFSTVTNALPAAIASYQWDFQGKAFQTADHDVYDSSHLLTAAQKTTANVTTKFITGSKSLVSNTDLGTRTVQLTVTDTSATLWNSTLRPYLMVHRANSLRAEIMPYHLAYEGNSYFTNAPDVEVSIQGTLYYFGADFRHEIKVQGTGVPYKIRTAPAQSKEEGVDPLPSQRYIMYNPPPQGQEEGTFSFSSQATVAAGSAARFYYNGGGRTLRSYYNTESYIIKDVDRLYDSQDPCADYMAYVNARINQFPAEEQPLPFTTSVVTIHDQGQFLDLRAIAIDEKHIDVFFEAAGIHGINKDQLISIIGTAWATVQKP